MKESYCVYEHVFPDGKRYIGLSKNVKSRWGNNGAGYFNNPKMRKAIEKYGWQNIRHTVIEDGLTKLKAQQLETELINDYDTIANGYNNRPGGTTGTSLYSKHVSKMLQACKQSPYDELHYFADRMYELSDDEGWACQVNLVDYVLREEVEGYKRPQSYEPVFEACAWYYYMSHWIEHPDIHVETLPEPMDIIMQNYRK